MTGHAPDHSMYSLSKPSPGPMTTAAGDGGLGQSSFAHSHHQHHQPLHLPQPYQYTSGPASTPIPALTIASPLSLASPQPPTPSSGTGSSHMDVGFGRPAPSYFNTPMQSPHAQSYHGAYQHHQPPVPSSPMDFRNPHSALPPPNTSSLAHPSPMYRGHQAQHYGSHAPHSNSMSVGAGTVMSNLSNPGGQMSMMHGMQMPYHHNHMHHPGYHGHHAQHAPQAERPFRCDQCPQSFNRNHDLKRHKRIHLEVKPFPCGHCDKSFSRKDALKRHRLVKNCGDKEDAQKDEKDEKDGTSPHGASSAASDASATTSPTQTKANTAPQPQQDVSRHEAVRHESQHDVKREFQHDAKIDVQHLVAHDVHHNVQQDFSLGLHLPSLHSGIHHDTATRIGTN